jgi:hypothetical protein
MRLYFFALIWIIFGLLLFMMAAEFKIKGWENCYWLWDRGKDLLLLGVITYRNRVRIAHGIGIVISFAVCSVILEILIIILGWNINETIIVRVLFTIYLLICFTALLIELRKWLRSNSG